MINPCIMLTRNNLHLTRKAVKTILAQDLEGGVDLFIIDNGSTDGTIPWLFTQRDLHWVCPSPPLSGVAESWNRGLAMFFGMGADYVLVVNNDIELRPDTYRHLINDGGGFVTAVGSDDPEKIKALNEPDASKKRPHPDFSCYLIRREVWEKVGPFDEKFLIAYAEDSDFHCRLHASGITAIALELPFLHYGAQTIKNADTADQIRIKTQAEKNREYFKQKYGFSVGSVEYYNYFGTGSPESA